MHIVDVLIAERAPHLVASPFWPVLRPILYGALSRNRAVDMADHIAEIGGRAAFDYVSQLLALKVHAKGIENIPKTGRTIFVANHPTGIADGVALYDCLKAVRPDVYFYANADAHRVCPRFDEILVPVEWELHKRTREKTRITLDQTKAIFKQDGALAIFPAGRLARIDHGELRDPEWMGSAVSIAKKYDAQIVPIHIDGPFAFWFHIFDLVSQQLRDITLFHELLNKRGKDYTITIAPPIASGGDSDAITLKLKDFIERRLRYDADARFG